ncbi:MAG: ribose-phosphate pyrophosphokinase [Clostridia bacterium]|nr:ribose-phosphate pyrophosphokinase [Clostridia bacterium]
MITHGNMIEILAGNSNRPLAEKVASELGIPVSNAEVTKFSDGEISITLPETVRGKDIFIIQSTSAPVNDNLMELLILIDACKRASAGRITAVMPYFGYARQDRKARPRDPITAKLVADILTSAGANRVMTMDLHAAQIQGFFEIPVDHLYGAPLLAKYYKNRMDENWVVVSPDVGSVGRARNFATRVDATLAIVDKRRPKANQIEVMNVIGDVKGKTCLMVDDMIDTAGTICQGAEALMKNGAKEVYACCTHGVFSGPAMERITASPIKELAVLDTINMPENVLKNPKIKVISSAKTVARAISSVFSDSSLSAIYED